LLLKLIQDAFVEGAVDIIRLGPDDIRSVLQAMERFDLDFDDAYQYVTAEKHNLAVVSYDADFDRTDRGRKTPAEALREKE
jgi:predicted nucleic acid-binding protein